MKKLYQPGKGWRVHPAPVPAGDAALAALLPAAVLALAAALTAEEQEVLAYLLSGSCGGGAAGGGGTARRSRRHGPHPPEMGCGCFGCYKSFWARWDASPNRHLIHRIIDAVEEGAGCGGGTGGGGPAGEPARRNHRRRRRGRGGRGRGGAAAGDDDPAEADVSANLLRHGCASDGGDYEGDEDDEADSIYGDEGEGAMTDGSSDCAGSSPAGGNAEKSTVGKLVRFIGEKVWGAWT